MGQLRLEGYEDGSSFFLLFKSVMVPTLDFDPSGILLRVGYVPPTVSQSFSRIFPKGFHFWIGSGPQSVVTSSPSFPGSLVSALRAIAPLGLGITQLVSSF